MPTALALADRCGILRLPGLPRLDGARHDEVQVQRIIVEHLADHLLVFSPQSCKLVRVGAQRRHELGERAYGLLLRNAGVLRRRP